FINAASFVPARNPAADDFGGGAFVRGGATALINNRRAFGGSPRPPGGGPASAGSGSRSRGCPQSPPPRTPRKLGSYNSRACSLRRYPSVRTKAPRRLGWHAGLGTWLRPRRSRSGRFAWVASRPTELGLHLLTVSMGHLARTCRASSPRRCVAKAPQRGAFEIAVRKPKAGSCPCARDFDRGACKSAPR